MITIKEIAQLANVSSSTVSRVLNNGYVSEAVRKRVLQIIEETGYVPSEHAKSLRTNETRVIGVILPRLSTETSSRIVNALNDELAANNYQIILTNTNLDPKKEIENMQLLRSRRVDGIILLATNVRQELVDAIQRLPIPMIALGQDIAGIPVVVNADYQAAKEMTAYLLTKGHERIAFIGVPHTDEAVGIRRQKGFQDALTEQGLKTEKAWMAEANFDFKSGYAAMEKIWQARSEKPTAVFAVTDKIAVGAMQYLKEQQIRIPEDVAIAGTGNSNISKYVTPALTTIDYLNEQSGKKAAALILEQIKNKHKPAEKVSMTYRLIKRDSV